MTLTATQSAIIHWVRFVCSQAVVLAHLFGFFHWEIGPFNAMGSYAVLVFFILSGFLIAFSIRQKSQQLPDYGLMDYLRDRFFRIYPPFVATLLLVFVLDIAQFEYTQQLYSFKQYIVNLSINLLQLQEFPLATYLNDHYMIEAFRFRVMGTNIPLWTISIEWWLYIFYGFLMFYIVKTHRVKMIHWALLLFFALSPLYYMFIAARMDKGLTLIWFLGALGVTAQFTAFKNLSKRTLLLSVLLLLIGLTGFFKLGYNGAILIFFLGFYFIMAHKTDRLTIVERSHSIAKFLADYSYSLYLTHYSLILFIMAVIPLNKNATELGLIYIFVNLFAFGFAYLFERPSAQWKKRYENYRSIRN
jgi:peptidoglycan/LPS O-acetylase OafA/YrhL